MTSQYISISACDKFRGLALSELLMDLGRDELRKARYNRVSIDTPYKFTVSSMSWEPSRQRLGNISSRWRKLVKASDGIFLQIMLQVCLPHLLWLSLTLTL
jgi:hypothetical protein